MDLLFSADTTRSLETHVRFRSTGHNIKLGSSEPQEEWGDLFFPRKRLLAMSVHMCGDIKVVFGVKDPIKVGVRRRKANVGTIGGAGISKSKNQREVCSYPIESNVESRAVHRKETETAPRPKSAVQAPRHMKRGPNIPTKRSLQGWGGANMSNPIHTSVTPTSATVGPVRNPQVLTHNRWDSGGVCVDRDLLNQELDNEISRYRKANWGKAPQVPDHTLLGAANRGQRIIHEKLQPRARLNANTNGPVVNFEREQRYAYV